MFYRINPEVYANLNPDLADLSNEQLLEHFKEIGVKEGRLGRLESLRVVFLDTIPKDRPILEIGPFCDPQFTGPMVKYADVLSTEELKEVSKTVNYIPDFIPHIDYVVRNEDYSIINEKFLSVFSCHCIEHIPDLIRHLQKIEKILDHGGRYYMVIPDKRYCFDHFIKESSISDVLEAYFDKKTRPSIREVINGQAFTTHNDAERHWNGDHGEIDRASMLDNIQKAIVSYHQERSDLAFAHVWQFTPESFFDIVSTIADLGYTRLRPVDIHPTVRPYFEFCAVLG